MATKTAKAAPKATKTTTKGARTYRPRTAAEKATRRVADKQRRSRAKRAAARAAALIRTAAEDQANTTTREADKDVVAQMRADLSDAYNVLVSAETAARKIANRHFGDLPNDVTDFEKAASMPDVGAIAILQRSVAMVVAAVVATDLVINRLRLGYGVL